MPAKLFQCPTCGGGLPNPESTAITCQYCGNTVVVPPEYVVKKEAPSAPTAPPQVEVQPVVINIGSAVPEIEESTRRGIGMMGIIIAIVIIGSLAIGAITIFGGVLAAMFGLSSFTQAMDDVQDMPAIVATAIPVNTAQATAAPTATPTQVPFAAIALEFGQQGSAPGQFDDPRNIAVDLQGNIYVSNYADGRVQKFGPDGTFVWLIVTEPNAVSLVNTINDLAVDTNGILYVARGGDILLFNTSDGSPAGVIPGNFPDLSYRRIALDATNRLFAINDTVQGNHLLRLDENGAIAAEAQNVIFSVTNQPGSIEGMAADGLGNAYLADSNASQIFKYNADGQFVDRLGSEGSGPGQINRAMAVAVDGQGRLFVVDLDSVEVYDNTGGHLGSIERRGLGASFDIAVDNQGGVYLVSNLNKVIKFTLTQP